MPLSSVCSGEYGICRNCGTVIGLAGSGRALRPALHRGQAASRRAARVEAEWRAPLHPPEPRPSATPYASRLLARATIPPDL